MALELRFQGIRCFSEPQEAEIRPITLLVGENSSGKTTFLAICEVAYAGLRLDRELPFNEAPFSLGSYDQIASQRGTKAGRAKSFSVTVALEGVEHAGSVFQEFVSYNGQPSIQRWRLTVRDVVFEAQWSPGVEECSIFLKGNAGESEFPLGKHRLDDAISTRSNWAPLVAAFAPRPVLDSAELMALQESQAAISGAFKSRPYALAPIRTSPQRTYDPVLADPRPEGSHVPMLLAGLSRSESHKPWKTLQSALNKFGKSSGLFEGIDVVNKGKKHSDPFQLGVKSGGPTFNLIDVGYGVSQALPILVDSLQRATGNGLLLLQQPEVHLHPRAQAELGHLLRRARQRRPALRH